MFFLLQLCLIMFHFQTLFHCPIQPPSWCPTVCSYGYASKLKPWGTTDWIVNCLSLVFSIQLLWYPILTHSHVVVVQFLGMCLIMFERQFCFDIFQFLMQELSISSNLCCFCRARRLDKTLWWSLNHLDGGNLEKVGKFAINGRIWLPAFSRSVCFASTRWN